MCPQDFTFNGILKNFSEALDGVKGRNNELVKDRLMEETEEAKLKVELCEEKKIPEAQI